MRAAFTLVSLLLALAIVGVLAKRQWGASQKPLPALSTSMDTNANANASASGTGTAPAAPATALTPQQQVQQIQQAVGVLVQQPRPLPDDAQ